MYREIIAIVHWIGTLDIIVPHLPLNFIKNFFDKYKINKLWKSLVRNLQCIYFLIQSRYNVEAHFYFRRQISSRKGEPGKNFKFSNRSANVYVWFIKARINISQQSFGNERIKRKMRTWLI